MNRVFADASYWIALLNPQDELHERAVTLAQEFSTATIVTSEMVLVEVLNSFSRRGRFLRGAAAQAVRAIMKNRGVVVWPQTTQQLQDALVKYEQAGDKTWSVTDCASFQIMQTERISDALTHDRHFAQADYGVLMDE